MRSNNIVRLSAAGSGKTWGICHDALDIVAGEADERRVLITTYTNRGIDAVEKEIKSQNRGVLSARIDVESWYTFLLRDLIRPYQSFITEINSIRSYDFSEPHHKINYAKKGERRRYLTGRGDIFGKYASEFAVELNSLSKGSVLKRIEKIYSHVFIDEVQDLAGYDLDIVDLLLDSATAVTCVGDNKQATYATHNTMKGKKLSGKNIWQFFSKREKEGKVKLEYCLESRRFNELICAFANAIFPGNDIATIMKEKTGHDGVFLILGADAAAYYGYFKPVVLKHDVRTKTDGYPSMNFGQCKGMTFQRVLIYPNGPLRDFIRKGKEFSSPEKYYVGVTRPKYSVAIVVDEFPNNPLYKNEAIQLDDIEIDVQRFVGSEG